MKNIKEIIKAKVDNAKDKIKAKVGNGAKNCSVIGAIVLVLAEAGCMDTNPASRATSSADKLGDITVKFENCSNCTGTVNYTKGDSALASADSSGSTETQTASPTQTTDVSPKTDVNTTGGRTAGVLETAISAGASALLAPQPPGGKDTACPDGACSDSPSACSTCHD